MVISREENGQHIQENIGAIGHLIFLEILSYDIPKKTIGYWINSWEVGQH